MSDVIRTALAAIAVGALWAPAASAAVATTDRSVAALDRKVAVSTLGSTSAWSEPAGSDGFFRLVVTSNGKRRRVPVARRRGPFDLDLGVDRRGRTVVTYTRCRDAGGPSAGGERYPHDAGAPGSACRAMSYRPGSRGEQRLDVEPGSIGAPQSVARADRVRAAALGRRQGGAGAVK